jgi:hypothetical protein
VYPVISLGPFDLGRSSALRNFEILPSSAFEDNVPIGSFLQKSLTSSSSPSGIETVDLNISWCDHGHGKDMFSSDAGWSTLDEILTGEKFVSHKWTLAYFAVMTTIATSWNTKNFIVLTLSFQR